MTAISRSDWEARGRRLIDALLDGTANEAEVAELDALLRSNASARRDYCDASELHASLRWMHRADEPTRVPYPAQAASRFALLPSRMAAWGLANARYAQAAALVFVLAAIGATAILLRSGWLGDDPSPRAENVVATLSVGEGCVWSGPRPVIQAGSGLAADEWLTLEQGIARLEFKGGATVLVESPAKFKPVSANSLWLENGNVAVRASGPVKDFVVLSRDAAIVDLGTCFAVHCDENSATEVEVLEGAVKVVPENDPRKERVLEMGASVQVDSAGKTVSPIARLPDDYRFTNLIEQLWGDIRVAQEGAASPDGNTDHTVEADFADAIPGAVDTFYAAKRGDGWLTPWVASGNPQGQIVQDDPNFGLGNPFLRVKFNGAYERAIAREYGPRPGFDPSQPHVISWKWRLDGKSSRIERNFFDRVTFYSNPFFRRSSWPTNSWLIGVVGGDEDQTASAQASTEFLKTKHGAAGQKDAVNRPREVHAQHWYFFDNQTDGVSGAVFDRRNMVNTGMKIKSNVLYRFAVAVYPEQARYDAAIRDDKETVVRTGLNFRSREPAPSNVLHFTMHALRSNDKRSFSLDSVRIEPLANQSLQEQLEAEASQDRQAAVRRGG
jgi:hypothetical protein